MSNLTLSRTKQDAEALKKARDDRWAWIHDCLELHKKARMKEVGDWDYVSQMYRSKEPDYQGLNDATMVYYGLDEGSEDDMFSRNELFAFIDQLVATICPPNPEVTVKARRKMFTDAAKFREVLINEVFRMENMAAKLWRAVGRACIFPRCFLKVTWNSAKTRPRIRVVNPHFMFYDEMASEWEDVRYVCEVRMLTRGEFMARVKKTPDGKGFYNLSHDLLKKVDFGSHDKWMKHHDTSGLYCNKGRNTQQAYKWVPVYEFYDLVSETVYHFVEGVKVPIYEAPLPYQLLKNPYYMLVFNDNLKNNSGLSDAELVRPTLDLLNDLNTLQLWHIKSGIPIPVIHEGLVDDPEDFASQYKNATGPRDIIRLAAQPRVRIEEVLGHTPMATLPIEWTRTTQQMLDVVERVLGLPGFARGQLGQTDVATEAALAGTAVRTRNNRRQKIVYQGVEWTAEAIIRLYIEYMPPDSDIPLQLMDGEAEVAASRDMFGFGTPVDGKVEADDPWDYRFQALAYNGDEDNRIVRLKNIIELLPSLIQNPEVNQRKLWSEVLSLVQLGKVMNSEQEMEQMQEAMAPPPGPGGPMGAPMGASPLGPLDPSMLGGAMPMGPTPPQPDRSAQAMTELGAENPQLTGAPIPGGPTII